jgi:hypothetical protein
MIYKEEITMFKPACQQASSKFQTSVQCLGFGIWLFGIFSLIISLLLGSGTPS